MSQSPESILLGMLGSSASLIFANVGAAYATAKAGVAVGRLGMVHPSSVSKGLVPVIMAGVLGIYGLIVAVVITNGIQTNSYTLTAGSLHFGAGLAAGLSSLAAGYAIGICGDSFCGGQSFLHKETEDRSFVAMILILIFAEALGLYGLIVGMLMSNTARHPTA